MGVSTACWMVTHIAKTTSRTDINSMSIRGASAFEGDANTTVYLVQEEDERFLMLGKRRFSTHIKALAFQVFSLDRVIMAPWGERTDMTVTYTLPEISDMTPAEIKAEKREVNNELNKEQIEYRIRQDIIKLLTDYGPMSFRSFQTEVQGQKALIHDIANRMVDEGVLLKQPRAGRGGGFEAVLNRDYKADAFDGEGSAE
jgi:hypothetical protein